MNWISTSELLPQDGDTVLLYDTKEGVIIGSYLDEKACYVQSTDGLHLAHVSHWMPMIKAPLSA
jgi:hypothetical protein